jgi:uncharacterized OB-fold protein
MAQVHAAGLYRPGHAADGTRVAGPDEDPFTMAVASLELLTGQLGGETPRRVALVGEFGPVAEWGFGTLLGAPVEIGRYPWSTSGAHEAVRAALQAPHPSLVIAAGHAARSSTENSSAGAVTIAFSSEARGASPPPPSPTGRTPPVVDGLTDWVQPLVELRTEDQLLPEAGPALWERYRSTSTSVVSEGAYVPMARYRENLPSRWNLLAERCAACGSVTFPARAACHHCGRADRLTSGHLPRDIARVVARTTIGKGGQPTEFDAQVAALGPYDVVLAQWPVGVRVTLPVTDALPGRLRIGDRVATRLRRLYPMDGEWRYGRKARPRGEPS